MAPKSKTAAQKVEDARNRLREVSDQVTPVEPASSPAGPVTSKSCSQPSTLIGTMGHQEDYPPRKSIAESINDDLLDQFGGTRVYPVVREASKLPSWNDAINSGHLPQEAHLYLEECNAKLDRCVAKLDRCVEDLRDFNDRANRLRESGDPNIDEDMGNREQEKSLLMAREAIAVEDRTDARRLIESIRKLLTEHGKCLQISGAPSGIKLLKGILPYWGQCVKFIGTHITNEENELYEKSLRMMDSPFSITCDEFEAEVRKLLSEVRSCEGGTELTYNALLCGPLAYIKAIAHSHRYFLDYIPNSSNAAVPGSSMDLIIDSDWHERDRNPESRRVCRTICEFKKGQNLQNPSVLDNVLGQVLAYCAQTSIEHEAWDLPNTHTDKYDQLRLVCCNFEENVDDRMSFQIMRGIVSMPRGGSKVVALDYVVRNCGLPELLRILCLRWSTHDFDGVPDLFQLKVEAASSRKRGRDEMNSV